MTINDPFAKNKEVVNPFANKDDDRVNLLDTNRLSLDKAELDHKEPILPDSNVVLSPNVESQHETDSNLISNPDPAAGSSPNFMNRFDPADPHAGLDDARIHPPKGDATVPPQIDQHIIPGKQTQAARMADDSKYVKTDRAIKTRADILRENGGLESNIPITSEYWQMKY